MTRQRIRVEGRDARLVGGIAVVSAGLMVLAGLAPTGGPALDAVLVFVSAAFVVWASASAPWWAGVVAAGVATAFAPSPGWLIVGLVPLFGGLAVGGTRRSLPWSRALITGIAMQVFAHLDNTQFFGFTSLLSIVVLGTLVVLGVVRRPRAERKKLWVGIGATAGALALALLGFALAGSSARPEIEEGNATARAALGLLGTGDLPGASAMFERAAGQFDAAKSDLDAPWGQPARLVPGVAQHRRAAASLVTAAAEGSREIAQQLSAIDYDALKVSGGRIDLDAVRALAAPTQALQTLVVDLIDEVGRARDPWLVDVVDEQLAELQGDLVSRQDEIDDAVAAVAQAPAMLGADDPRVYFVAFTTPAESRGLGGFMGNWAEVTIDEGAISVSAFGRTGDLARSGLQTKRLVTPTAEFRSLYQRSLWSDAVSPSAGTGVWSNITVSPHFPSVAGLIAELYPQSGGVELDGAFAMDVFAIAQLMELTGPVTLPNGRVLDSSNAADYLLREQYLTSDNAERIDDLEVVAQQSIERLLTSDLPAPPELGRLFGPVAREGRLAGWAVREAEQDVFRRVGITAELPILDGADGFGLAFNNGSANKIDVFLEGSVTYDVKVNRLTDRVSTSATITVRNEAPASGLPEYVIGNTVGVPMGTNRIQVMMFSALPVQSLLIDGVSSGFLPATEQGMFVTSTFIDIPSGATVTLQLDTSGPIAPDAEYRLVTRLPAAVNPFGLQVNTDLNNTDPPPEFVP